MAIYPFSFPTPSAISVPAIIDPFHKFETDQGYEVLRPMHSRGRRQFQVEYTKLTTAEMRVLQDFFQTLRGGVADFEWLHSTAFDTAATSNTTPVVCTFFHAYQTGHWVWVHDSTPNTSLNGFWTVTRLGPNEFALNGSTAGGAGTCNVSLYLPHATGRFSEGVIDAPIKLIGPETTNVLPGRSQPHFQWSVVIEELF